MLSLGHVDETRDLDTHDPDLQPVLGFMAWLGDQITSPGSQPQDPLFCLRAPAL